MDTYVHTQVEDWENGSGSEDINYVDKEIIEQQLQTKTYELSREDAKLGFEMEMGFEFGI